MRSRFILAEMLEEKRRELPVRKARGVSLRDPRASSWTDGDDERRNKGKKDEN